MKKMTHCCNKIKVGDKILCLVNFNGSFVNRMASNGNRCIFDVIEIYEPIGNSQHMLIATNDHPMKSYGLPVLGYTYSTSFAGNDFIHAIYKKKL